jgi:alkanesulfonate monooxygenase SsuD/methylene tetrahydromethanopterin reductase-like flavin-dependent oxidoreductase (luciferase family)
MRVGFYVTGSADAGYRELLDQIEYADAEGFDSVWLRERHFHPDQEGRNCFSSPLVVASYVAARTRRVRIGIGARILPLDHPIRIAEDAATVDLISGGRLDLGIARIGENDLYQSGFGVDPADARERFEEALDVILAAWSGERFAHDGRHWSFPEVAAAPLPAQSPHPPIYLVGISEDTLRFGARRGFPLLLAAAQPPALVAETQERYYELLGAAGFGREEVVLPVNRFVYVGETNEGAIEDTRETVMRFMRRPDSVIREFLGMTDDEITWERLLDEVFIFGDADRCTERILELREQADLRDAILTFNYFTIDHERCLASMRRFVECVLPEIRDAGVPGAAAVAAARNGGG